MGRTFRVTTLGAVAVLGGHSGDAGDSVLVAAGARDGWAYVWPRDASAAGIACAEAGYRPEAERTVQFLLGLGLEFAARFHGDILGIYRDLLPAGALP